MYNATVADCVCRESHDNERHVTILYDTQIMYRVVEAL